MVSSREKRDAGRDKEEEPAGLSESAIANRRRPLTGTHERSEWVGPLSCYVESAPAARRLNRPQEQ